MSTTIYPVHVDAQPDLSAGAEVPALSWLIAIPLSLAGTALVLAVIFIVVPVRAAGRGELT